MKTIEQVEAFINQNKNLSNADLMRALKINSYHVIGARVMMNAILDFINSEKFGFDNMIEDE